MDINIAFLTENCTNNSTNFSRYPLILIVLDNSMFIYATSLYANVKRKIWRQAIPLPAKAGSLLA